MNIFGSYFPPLLILSDPFPLSTFPNFSSFSENKQKPDTTNPPEPRKQNRTTIQKKAKPNQLQLHKNTHIQTCELMRTQATELTDQDSWELTKLRKLVGVGPRPSAMLGLRSGCSCGILKMRPVLGWLIYRVLPLEKTSFSPLPASVSENSVVNFHPRGNVYIHSFKKKIQQNKT